MAVYNINDINQALFIYEMIKRRSKVIVKNRTI